MNFVTSISLVVLGAMFLALLGWGSIRAAWRNCEGRRGVFAALAILAAVCSIVAQKPSPDTPTITVDALLRDVGCYATNNVFHAAVTNAPSYAGVDFSDCDLMVYARERASTNAASWLELTPRKKFSQQPADYEIENATNFNYMVYLDYVPPSPVHTNGVFELHGFVIEDEAQGEPDQLAAGFINSRAVPLPFDAEVEYLKSTGTQWIDTGLPGVDGYTFKADFMYTSLYSAYNYLAGSGVSSNNRIYFTRKSNAGGDVRTFRLTYNNSPNTSYRGVNVGEWVSITSIAEQGHQEVIVDGDTVYTATINTPVNTGKNIYLFCSYYPTTGTTGEVAVKLRSAQFIYNGTLVRDFIPVRVGTIGALYDKRGVGGMNSDGSPRNDGMYFNRGTGNFGFGNDK